MEIGVEHVEFEYIKSIKVYTNPGLIMIDERIYLQNAIT